MLQHAVVNRHMNKVPNPNLKLNYVKGVVMIIIQEVVAQLKVNNCKKCNKKDYFAKMCRSKKNQPEALKSLYRSPGYKKNQLVLCKNYVLQW